jgi:hypothetical protein
MEIEDALTEQDKSEVTFLPVRQKFALSSAHNRSMRGAMT